MSQYFPEKHSRGERAAFQALSVTFESWRKRFAAALDASFLTSSSDSCAYCEHSWLSKGIPPVRPSCLVTLLLSAGMALHWAESFSFSLHTNRESASWQHAVRHPDWHSHVAKTVTRVRQCACVCVCGVTLRGSQKKKKRREKKTKQSRDKEGRLTEPWPEPVQVQPQNQQQQRLQSTNRKSDKVGASCGPLCVN